MGRERDASPLPANEQPLRFYALFERTFACHTRRQRYDDVPSRNTAHRVPLAVLNLPEP